MECPDCNRQIVSDSRFCSYCGKELRSCTKCQRFYHSDAEFCGTCGESLTSSQTLKFSPPTEEPDDDIFGYLYDLTADPEPYPLYLGDNTIGAGGNNDIVIRRPAVSWNHAILIGRYDHVLIQDSASTNGTYINGKRLRLAKRLKHDDLVRFGSEEFRIWLKDELRHI